MKRNLKVSGLVGALLLMLTIFHAAALSQQPPPPPEVSDISLEVSVMPSAVVHATAEVKAEHGNISDLKGFVISFEIENGNDTIRRYARTDEHGRADVCVKINQEGSIKCEERKRGEVVVHAHWIGSSSVITQRINLSSSDSTKRVPLLSPVSTVLMICIMFAISLCEIKRKRQ